MPFDHGPTHKVLDHGVFLILPSAIVSMEVDVSLTGINKNNNYK